MLSNKNPTTKKKPSIWNKFYMNVRVSHPCNDLHILLEGTYPINHIPYLLSKLLCTLLHRWQKHNYCPNVSLTTHLLTQLLIFSLFLSPTYHTPSHPFSHTLLPLLTTQRNKPWLQSLDKTKDKNLLLWKKELDSLPLGAINSSNYKMLGTKITLGLFHPNK